MKDKEFPVWFLSLTIICLLFNALIAWMVQDLFIAYFAFADVLFIFCAYNLFQRASVEPDEELENNSSQI